MALDKVVDSAVLDAEMTSVANAIRAKTGNTDTLAWPDGFLTAIAEITGGGGAGLAYDMGEFVLDADEKNLDPPLFLITLVKSQNSFLFGRTILQS